VIVKVKEILAKSKEAEENLMWKYGAE